jgi:hypothetical protein
MERGKIKWVEKEIQTMKLDPAILLVSAVKMGNGNYT